MQALRWVLFLTISGVLVILFLASMGFMRQIQSLNPGAIGSAVLFLLLLGVLGLLKRLIVPTREQRILREFARDERLRRKEAQKG